MVVVPVVCSSVRRSLAMLLGRARSARRSQFTPRRRRGRPRRATGLGRANRRTWLPARARAAASFGTRFYRFTAESCCRFSSRLPVPFGYASPAARDTREANHAAARSPSSPVSRSRTPPAAPDVEPKTTQGCGEVPRARARARGRSSARPSRRWQKEARQRLTHPEPTVPGVGRGESERSSNRKDDGVARLAPPPPRRRRLAVVGAPSSDISRART